ncbi:ABC transporter G family member 1-like [Populus alba]|uniref:ABC transporter G family member 1-like n=1 Tax=Populus alba TaxID=43335 RepID=UPI003CC750B1
MRLILLYPYQIIGRERSNGQYGAGVFVVGNTRSSIPCLLMISLIPGAIAFYIVGLQKSLEHFVYFALLLFVCMMLVESLMMIVAGTVPDFLMGIITGAGIQGVMMLLEAFSGSPDRLPKPLRRYPVHYIALHKHANQGFYKNHFEILKGWHSLTMNGGSYRLMFWGIVKLVEKVKPIIKAAIAAATRQPRQISENPSSSLLDEARV